MRIRHLISIGFVAFVSAGLGTVAAAGPQHAATATRYEHYTSVFPGARRRVRLVAPTAGEPAHAGEAVHRSAPGPRGAHGAC